MAEKKQAEEVVPQQELAGGATFTSEPQDYAAHDVVVIGCLNGTPGPTQPLHVSLECSQDEGVWVPCGRKVFGPLEGQKYLQTFALAEVAAAGAWRKYRLAFGSHQGGKVTIAASTGQAPVFEEPEEKKEAKHGAEHKQPKHEDHPKR